MRVLEQAITTYINYSDTVLFTTSELSLREIPSDINQSIATKLAQMDLLLAESEYPYMIWMDTDVLFEAWPEVYQI